MKIFRVGGSVRDELLGRVPKDFDYVIVGGSVEALLASGYRQVGADFPVFIGPDGAEYALARRERRSGKGHNGFAVEFDPGVTLEEDLARRDLTVNAMARSADGKLVDPFGGEADLRAGRLRHVRDDAFPEDPLRVLRVARFAAQLGFEVAPETMALMFTMVQDGMLAELTAERVFWEISRALGSPFPQRFVTVMAHCGALGTVLPEVAALLAVPENPEYHPEGTAYAHTLLVLEAAAKIAPGDSALGWAALCHDLGKAQTDPALWPKHAGHEERSAALAFALLDRLRAPVELRDSVAACAAQHMRAKKWEEMRPGRVLRMLEALSVHRHPERLRLFLDLCEADERGRWRPVRENYFSGLRKFLAASTTAMNSVRARDLLGEYQARDPERKPGPWVGEVLTAHRVRAIAAIARGE